jgi:hypothetical protein
VSVDPHISERVRKLLALAADRGATQAEAELAAEKAAALMLAHSIDEAALAEGTGRPLDIGKATLRPFRGGRWRRLLAGEVAASAGGLSVYGGLGPSLHIFAPRGVLRAILETYVGLELRLEAVAAEAVRGRPQHISARKFRSNFLEGAVFAISNRLTAREADAAEGESRALALIRTRVEEVAEADLGPLTNGRARRGRSLDDDAAWGAFSAGQEAAEDLDLGHAKLAPTAQRALPRSA